MYLAGADRHISSSFTVNVVCPRLIPRSQKAYLSVVTHCCCLHMRYRKLNAKQPAYQHYWATACAPRGPPVLLLFRDLDWFRWLALHRAGVEYPLRAASSCASPASTSAGVKERSPALLQTGCGDNRISPRMATLFKKVHSESYCCRLTFIGLRLRYRTAWPSDGCGDKRNCIWPPIGVWPGQTSGVQAQTKTWARGYGGLLGEEPAVEQCPLPRNERKRAPGVRMSPSALLLSLLVEDLLKYSLDHQGRARE